MFNTKKLVGIGSSKVTEYSPALSGKVTYKKHTQFQYFQEEKGHGFAARTHWAGQWTLHWELPSQRSQALMPRSTKLSSGCLWRWGENCKLEWFHEKLLIEEKTKHSRKKSSRFTCHLCSHSHTFKEYTASFITSINLCNTAPLK